MAEQVGDQQLEGSRKNGREVAGGMGVSEQVASRFELALQGGVDCQLELIAFGGEGFDAVPRRFGR